jgi:hypothetical protein
MKSVNDLSGIRRVLNFLFKSADKLNLFSTHFSRSYMLSKMVCITPMQHADERIFLDFQPRSPYMAIADYGQTNQEVCRRFTIFLSLINQLCEVRKREVLYVNSITRSIFFTDGGSIPIPWQGPIFAPMRINLHDLILTFSFREVTELNIKYKEELLTSISPWSLIEVFDFIEIIIREYRRDQFSRQKVEDTIDGDKLEKTINSTIGYWNSVRLHKRLSTFGTNAHHRPINRSPKRWLYLSQPSTITTRQRRFFAPFVIEVQSDSLQN